jgi:ATP-dependent helicase/nuclease subunit B
MTFIQQLVQFLAEESFDLTNTLIVLPSERPKKYIQKALYEHYQKPIFSPQMVTMDKWVRDLSKETVIDKTRALLNLYEVFLKDTNYQYQDSFQQFLNYGTALLNDYDELDRYLLDHKQVFKNLVDIKEIENWSFDAETLTPAQQKFMEFWEKLPGYYEVLNENLKAKGQCYMGKAYRHLAENIDLIFEKNKSLKIVFAGFNALSPAEISIMKQLKNMGRGFILFDVDKYYMEKNYHEAGFFIKKNLSTLDMPLKDFPDRMMREKKQVDFIQCAYQTDQVKVAAGLLKKMSPEQQKETMILLADEKLISPLLQNLPLEIQKANITLGLPLSQSIVKSWVELFFNFQHHKAYFKTEALYIRDLQDFFNHPFLYNLLTEEEKINLFELDQNLISKNAVFKNLKSLPLNDRIKNLLFLMSENWENDWTKALLNIKAIIVFLYNELEETFEYERAILQHFHAAMIELENLIHSPIPS